MITPDLLLRYSFFDFLSADQRKAITAVALEEKYRSQEIIFRENQPAQGLYILLTGSVELFFSVEVKYHPSLRKELQFTIIKPGEVFGISACIEPHILTSSARTLLPCRVIKIPISALEALCREDEKLACAMIHQVGKTAFERLNDARFQLAVILSPVRA